MLALVVALSGCPTPRTGTPPGATIAVQQFAVPESAVIQRYGRAPEQVGMRFAELLAERLDRLGYSATAVPAGFPLQGDYHVTGSIAEIDGGSTAKRLLFGAGAGRTEFDVRGTVTRADGTRVGDFTESRAGGGWTQDGALDSAMQRTINMIARMIYTGTYLRNAPQGRPGAEPETAAAAGAAKAPTEERLRTLERLRADGTITAEEYEEKRRAILSEL